MKVLFAQTQFFRSIRFAQFALIVGVIGCGQGNAEQECVPADTAAAKVNKISRTQIRIDDSKERANANWCRSCILGPKGWASCQVAWDATNEEAREALEARARDLACKDAGFGAGQCPPAPNFNTRCKGDKIPEGSVTPGKALQNIYLKKTGRDSTLKLVPTKPSTAVNESEKPTDEKPPESKSIDVSKTTPPPR